ncbi:MAG: carboxypeptidase regulatory-like domain-containing protein [Bacteroidales bacterium]|nr:carboxypeptidase regulatory-like domain-containing protein [Bacteroidales bacterium]
MEKFTFRSLCLGLLLLSTSAFSQEGSDFLGRVLYHNDDPMSGVNVSLMDQSGDIVSTTVTDNEGYYEFDNLNTGTYSVSFSTNQQAGGVELSDAFLVMLKLLNQITFTPIQTLAADVNGSGTITWADYFMILIGYLNQGNPFPIGPWVFENAQFTIPNPAREGLISKAGSSSGDVNGSLVPDPKSSNIFVEYLSNDIFSGENERIDFKVSIGQDITTSGMHLSFRIPANLEIMEVEPIMDEAKIYLSADRLNVTWMDETLSSISLKEGEMLLRIRARERSVSNNPSTYTFVLDDKSHFIDRNGEMAEGLKLNIPLVNITVTKKIASAYPNPFTSQVTFDFNMTEAGTVGVILSDLAGRIVFVRNEYIETVGRNQIKAQLPDLKPGIYNYTVRKNENGETMATGTLLKSN